MPLRGTARRDGNRRPVGGEGGQDDGQAWCSSSDCRSRGPSGLWPALANAQDLTKLRFGTNWLAEAEHGGFYQAVADGTYKKYGLDVEIVQGGPQANNALLLPAGKIDFYMGGNCSAFVGRRGERADRRRSPRMFQKDPQILMSHPGVGLDTFADLQEGDDILSARNSSATCYQWMKAAYGFTRRAGQALQLQPGAVHRRQDVGAAGLRDLRAARGREAAAASSRTSSCSPTTASTPIRRLIEARHEMVEKQPDIVQRFVDASIIGWYNYLYGDNKAANDADQERQSGDDGRADRLLDRQDRRLSASSTRRCGRTLGIGAMTDEQMKNFSTRWSRRASYKAEPRLQEELHDCIREQEGGPEVRR